jgi:hypothetical protein
LGGRSQAGNQRGGPAWADGGARLILTLHRSDNLILPLSGTEQTFPHSPND